MGGLGRWEDQAAQSYAGLHDIRRAKAMQARLGPTTTVDGAGLGYMIAATAEDWPGAVAITDAVIASYPKTENPLQIDPLSFAQKARALRSLGRLDEAEAVLSPTPLDCQDCVIERGLLAAARGDSRLADHWLGQAVKLAPTIPHANLQWGRVLLARGDSKAAIARFEAAARQGPRFAEPISFWGEALLKRGEAKAAIAKFREADKYAPRWGRNHLLWGEALAKLGRGPEAQAQFAAAAGMDLTASERGELAKIQGAR